MKFKRSILLPVILFLFSTGMFLYFSFWASQKSPIEDNLITLGVEYLLIAALFIILRKKEKMAKEREADIDKNKHNTL